MSDSDSTSLSQLQEIKNLLSEMHKASESSSAELEKRRKIYKSLLSPEDCDEIPDVQGERMQDETSGIDTMEVGTAMKIIGCKSEQQDFVNFAEKDDLSSIDLYQWVSNNKEFEIKEGLNLKTILKLLQCLSSDTDKDLTVLPNLALICKNILAPSISSLSNCQGLDHLGNLAKKLLVLEFRLRTVSDNLLVPLLCLLKIETDKAVVKLITSLTLASLSLLPGCDETAIRLCVSYLRMSRLVPFNCDMFEVFETALNKSAVVSDPCCLSDLAASLSSCAGTLGKDDERFVNILWTIARSSPDEMETKTAGEFLKCLEHCEGFLAKSATKSFQEKIKH